MKRTLGYAVLAAVSSAATISIQDFEWSTYDITGLKVDITTQAVSSAQQSPYTARMQRYYGLASSNGNGNGNSGSQAPNANANESAQDNAMYRNADSLQDYANIVQHVVMSWWNDDGRDLVLAAGSSAQAWINNTLIPFGTPIV